MNGNGSKLHKVTNLLEGTKLHEDKFASRVSFAQITILHESNKNTKKNKKIN